MKPLLLFPSLVFSGLLPCFIAQLQAANVECGPVNPHQGTVCGGNGGADFLKPSPHVPLMYIYHLGSGVADPGTSATRLELGWLPGASEALKDVGVWDGNGNPLVFNWGFANAPIQPVRREYVTHDTLTEASDTTTRVLWWEGDFPEGHSYYFGFNSPDQATGESLWHLTFSNLERASSSFAIWVGRGQGPQHVPCPIPEPATSSLVALCLLTILSRRKANSSEERRGARQGPIGLICYAEGTVSRVCWRPLPPHGLRKSQ